MTRYFIIVNPVAGRGEGARQIPQIHQLLSSQHLSYDLVQTERPWHAAELAKQAVSDGYDVVVTVGGDGTANEVINGLMTAKTQLNKSAAMGALSVGRGNDFAYGMGVPTDLESGCQALVQNKRRMIDVGWVQGGDFPQGRYFGNGVGIGFDAVVGFESAKMTRLTGFVSYVIAALKTIFLYFHAPLVRIELDEDKIETKSLLISIMNGRRMGGGFLMAPKGLPDDGWFDLCIASQVSRLRILSLIPYFMRGTQETQKEIRAIKSRKVYVTALEGTLPAHADGETLCIAGQQLSLLVLPQQIEMVVAEASAKNT